MRVVWWFFFFFLGLYIDDKIGETKFVAMCATYLHGMTGETYQANLSWLVDIPLAGR